MPDFVKDVTNAALGLQRGTVRFSEHNRRWSFVYALIASEIAEVTGVSSERIQHVGSTAVPELAAKPILDIAIGVGDGESVGAIVGHLVGIGYLDRGDGEGSIGRLVVRESSPEVRTVHVHMVGYGTEEWRSYVAFRDALLNDPLVRDQYADVKRTLAQSFPEDRKSYRTAKNAFIVKTLEVLSSGRAGADPVERSARH